MNFVISILQFGDIDDCIPYFWFVSADLDHSGALLSLELESFGKLFGDEGDGGASISHDETASGDEINDLDLQQSIAGLHKADCFVQICGENDA